jgi:acetyltransferase-like isoleucine patch superfamily enzyme
MTVPDHPDEMASLSLADAMRRLGADQDAAMRQQWNRSLPLGEELFDRWERAQSLGFGEQASIYHHAYVYGDVKVGDHTWIGPMTLLDGSGGLTIGSWCAISAGVHIYTHNTVDWAVTAGAADYRRAPTSIGDRTFIGPLSVVAMGVTVGARCVVGAHAYVNCDVPDESIAVGVPARVVGRVEVSDGGDVRYVYTQES